MKCLAALRRRRRARRAEPGSGTELDALADALDLGRLTGDQFVRLLETLRMLDEAGAGVSVSGMRTQSLVDLIARASRRQLKAVAAHGELRVFLLEELFRRMANHVLVDRTENVSVVIAWNFIGGVEPLEFHTLIECGTCETAPDLGLPVDTTVTVTIDDFLRMATAGNPRALSMFLTGRIRVRGDYAVAARFLGYFDIPRPTLNPR